MGHQDRAVLSWNTVPFDFAKIDLRSNSVHYSFLHGSLVGADTSGRRLRRKYIAAHRFEFNAGRRVRIGLNEAILYSNQPISFTMLNPLIFLTSAELSTELPNSGDDAHNSLIWLDLEVMAARNLRLFGSFLIDDLKFGTIDADDISRNTNKFGWQAGIIWNDAFTLPGVLLSAEYRGSILSWDHTGRMRIPIPAGTFRWGKPCNRTRTRGASGSITRPRAVCCSAARCRSREQARTSSTLSRVR